jgi:hypothetical protein
MGKSISLFVGVFVFLLVLQVVGADVCYQSLPNASSSCGASSLGNILATDNSYDPYVDSVLFNYTKPLGGNGVVWQVELGWNVSASLPYLLNVSVPESCWVASNDSVLLRMNSNYIYCYAGNGSCDTAYSQVACLNSSAEWEWLFSTPVEVQYCRYFNPAGAFYSYVYDEKWFSDDNSSYAYFCHTFPTRHFMYYGSPIYLWQSCVRQSLLFEQGVYWDISCVEDWANISPSCNGIIPNYAIDYVDLNNCGTENNLPLDHNNIVDCCVENWVGNFSVCRNGVHTWSWVDTNVCNTTFQLPVSPLNGSVSGCSEFAQGGGGGGSAPVVNVSKSVLVGQSVLGGGADTSAFARFWSRLWDWLIFWK